MNDIEIIFKNAQKLHPEYFLTPTPEVVINVKKV